MTTHYYAAARPEGVQISVSLDHEEVQVVVCDHGPGLKTTESALPPDPLSETGRGLFLMQALMDSVEFLRRVDARFFAVRHPSASLLNSPGHLGARKIVVLPRILLVPWFWRCLDLVLWGSILRIYRPEGTDRERAIRPASPLE